jgi:hypothetical protein
MANPAYTFVSCCEAAVQAAAFIKIMAEEGFGVTSPLLCEQVLKGIGGVI